MNDSENESEEVCHISENENGHLDVTFLAPSALSPESIPRTEALLHAVVGRASADGASTDILLDMSRIDFVSSAALNLMLQVRHSCEEKNIRFGLTQLTPQIREVFQVTKLDRLFEIQPERKICGV